MTTRVLWLALSIPVIGCMSLGAALANHPVPGYGVSEGLASSIGCELEVIKTRGDQYRKDSYAEGGPGYVVPSVGDTGCDVLAKLGRPDDFDTITTFVKGEKNSPSETPRGAKIAANASTVTPLSPRSSLPT